MRRAIAVAVVSTAVSGCYLPIPQDYHPPTPIDIFTYTIIRMMPDGHSPSLRLDEGRSIGARAFRPLDHASLVAFFKGMKGECVSAQHASNRNVCTVIRETHFQQPDSNVEKVSSCWGNITLVYGFDYLEPVSDLSNWSSMDFFASELGCVNAWATPSYSASDSGQAVHL